LGQHYRSRNRILLTGTPLQNSLTELWALLNFLLPKVFASSDTFEGWFSAPLSGAGVTVADQLSEEESLLVIRRLHQVLRPFLLRRLKADVLKMGEQLPTKQEDIILCDQSEWQKFMYKTIVKCEKIVYTDNHFKRRRAKLSNPTMQLKKIVNHPFLFYPDYAEENDITPELWRASGKFDMLDSVIMKMLRSGHRILIFNQMTKVLELQERLLDYRKIPFLRLDGSTRPEDRRESVEQFNKPGSKYSVFLLTTRAGGLGVNLQTADTVIIFDSDWNPQADLQAQDRAHRIGQEREVRVLRFITARSIEEDVLEKASFKRGLEQKIIKAGMFDGEAKDSERQALLREMLRLQEDNSDGEGDELPSAEELNRTLARSDEEFELFMKIDGERRKEIEGRPTLMGADEIPSWITHPVLSDDGEDIEDNDDPFYVPRRKRNTAVVYDLDNMSDDQYIRMIEKGEEDGATLAEAAQSVRRKRPAPAKDASEKDDESEKEKPKKRQRKSKKKETDGEEEPDEEQDEASMPAASPRSGARKSLAAKKRPGAGKSLSQKDRPRPAEKKKPAPVAKPPPQIGSGDEDGELSETKEPRAASAAGDEDGELSDTKGRDTASSADEDEKDEEPEDEEELDDEDNGPSDGDNNFETNDTPAFESATPGFESKTGFEVGAEGFDQQPSAAASSRARDLHTVVAPPQASYGSEDEEAGNEGMLKDLVNQGRELDLNYNDDDEELDMEALAGSQDLPDNQNARESQDVEGGSQSVEGSEQLPDGRTAPESQEVEGINQNVVDSQDFPNNQDVGVDAMEDDGGDDGGMYPGYGDEGVGKDDDAARPGVAVNGPDSEAAARGMGDSDSAEGSADEVETE